LCRRILFDFHHGGLCPLQTTYADSIAKSGSVSNLIPNKIYNKHIPGVICTVIDPRIFIFFFFTWPWPTTFLHSKQRWCLEWKHMIIFYQCCHPRRLSQLKIRKFISRLRFCGACLFMTWRFNILKFFDHMRLIHFCARAKWLAWKVFQSKRSSPWMLKHVKFYACSLWGSLWLVYRVVPGNFEQIAKGAKLQSQK
jgi:hypothetical protein